MGRHLEVPDRRMAAAVTLVRASPLLAGTPALMRAVLGDRLLHRGACAPRGAATLGCDLGAARGLAWCVRTDRPASPWTAPGGGARRALWTPLTSPGGKLGVGAQDPRDGVAPRTSDGPGRQVQGAVVLGEARPALRPGAGHAGDALRGPWRQAWTGHGPICAHLSI